MKKRSLCTFAKTSSLYFIHFSFSSTTSIDILFKNDKEIHIGCIGNNKDIRRAIVNLFVLQHKWILVMQLECAILIILCTSLIILRVCKYPGIKNVIFLIPIIICCAVVMIICRNLRRRTTRVISQIVGDKSWVAKGSDPSV